nr:MAG TPA: hypothetical protein [Caudoviricetes sp.]
MRLISLFAFHFLPDARNANCTNIENTSFFRLTTTNNGKMNVRRKCISVAKLRKNKEVE